MPKILREEDISMGFRAPFYSVTTCIPECNVCIYWDGPGKCKNLVIRRTFSDGVNAMTALMLF